MRWPLVGQPLVEVGLVQSRFPAMQVRPDLRSHVTVVEQPLFILLAQHGTDETDDAGLVGEDAEDIGPSLDLFVKTLQRVGNRYEDRGVRRSVGADEVPTYGANIRDEGAPGARKGEQADPLDELRTRLGSRPPLRLARLCRERGSVGVVSPTAPVDEGRRGDATGDWDGYPPNLWRGGVLGRWPVTAGGPDRDDTIGAGRLRSDA